LLGYLFFGIELLEFGISKMHLFLEHSLEEAQFFGGHLEKFEKASNPFAVMVVASHFN